MLLLSHGWVIGRLFGNGKSSESQVSQFIRYGIGETAEVKEPSNPEVDRKAAEILKTGRLTISG